MAVFSLTARAGVGETNHGVLASLLGRDGRMLVSYFLFGALNTRRLRGLEWGSNNQGGGNFTALRRTCLSLAKMERRDESV